MMLVLLAALATAVAGDESPPLDLTRINDEVLPVLASSEALPADQERARTRLGEVFAQPERLVAVPRPSEVARYWQAHGLVALHRGEDPRPALRLACLLDKTPTPDIALPDFYPAFTEACALRPPALVPLDLGELSGIAVVWVDGASHGIGRHVRSGQHLVQVTEEGALVSSRWVRAVADPTLAPSPAPPPTARRCSNTCRGLRIGGSAALVVAGGLTAVAVYAAVEDEDDGEAAVVGASVAAGLGLTGLLISGRF